jgi:hypothetical protein
MKPLPPKVSAARRDILRVLAERVAGLNGITETRLAGRNRSGNEVHARKMFAQVAREFGFSLPEIGRALGGRDHSTIIAMLRNPMEISSSIVDELRLIFDRAKARAMVHPFMDGASVLTTELTPDQMWTLVTAAEYRGTTPSELLSSIVTVIIRDDLIAAVLDR